MADSRHILLFGGSRVPGSKLALDLGVLTKDQAHSTLDALVAELFATLLRLPVYRYLVSAFGDTKDAEDFTQEAFLQLFRALRRGERVDHPRRLVFRVAHNLAVSRGNSGNACCCRSKG